MIWSLIKLSFGIFWLLIVLFSNCVTWLLYFGWDSKMFLLFITDKKEGIQYFFYNPVGWAFKIKKLAYNTFKYTSPGNEHSGEK